VRKTEIKKTTGKRKTGLNSRRGRTKIVIGNSSAAGKASKKRTSAVRKT